MFRNRRWSTPEFGLYEGTNVMTGESGIAAGDRDEHAKNSRSIQDAPTELLTLQEAARILRCSKAHLCNVLKGRLASLPPLPHFSVGRRTLIRRAVLQQWIERLEESA